MTAIRREEPNLSQTSKSGNLHAHKDCAQPKHYGNQGDESCGDGHDTGPIPPPHAPFNNQRRNDRQPNDEHLHAKWRRRGIIPGLDGEQQEPRDYGRPKRNPRPGSKLVGENRQGLIPSGDSENT